MKTTETKHQDRKPNADIRKADGGGEEGVRRGDAKENRKQISQ